MHLGVFGQVVAPGELFVTHCALIRLDSRVRPPMAGQLIRAREPLKHKTQQDIHISSQLWKSFNQGLVTGFDVKHRTAYLQGSHTSRLMNFYDLLMRFDHFYFSVWLISSMPGNIGLNKMFKYF